MKVLVFGKTGQVAQELQRHAEVTALGRDDADLRDPAACFEKILESEADVIINAAAFTAVDKAEEEEALAAIINGDTPAAMAKACASKDIPLVHISTDYVFSGSGVTPWQPDDVTKPLSAYGRSKLAGEDGIRAIGGKFAILRTSWVFSTHGNNFLKSMLRLGKTHNVLRIVEDQIGGPTAAADVARACLIMGSQLAAGKIGGTYHFSGAPDVSWADFAREIFLQKGLNVDVIGILSSAYPTLAKRPLNSQMNCTSLAADFGISRPDWRESLKEMLDN